MGFGSHVLPLALAVVLALPADASAPLIADNPCLERSALNIAHQGGEIEAPSETLYAFKTAKQKGADAIETDVHLTADGRVVVLHDEAVDRTTNGSGSVEQMTLKQLKQLDAAYWFIEGEGTVHDAGRPASDFTWRGVATGEPRRRRGSSRTTSGSRLSTRCSGSSRTRGSTFQSPGPSSSAEAASLE